MTSSSTNERASNDVMFYFHVLRLLESHTTVTHLRLRLEAEWLLRLFGANVLSVPFCYIYLDWKINIMESNSLNDGSARGLSKENVAQTKRKLRLELNISGSGMKKQRSSLNPLLTSPDLNMLKLASPELEQLVLQQLPSAGHQMFPHVTHDQEEFAKGFVDSLEEMHNQNSSTSSSSHQYTTLQPSSELRTQPQIKVEPPVSSATPPLSPIDMENQERIKLERKRLRNRIAASKCRRRKLERIGRLEDKVNILKGENTDLQSVVLKLRDQVYALKKEVMEHVQSGCQISIAVHP